MPLFWLSLAFIAGIGVAASISLPVPVWLGSAAGSLSGACGMYFLAPRLARRFSRRSAPSHPSPLFPRLAFLFLAGAVFTGGAARYQGAQPTLTPGFIAWYNDLQTPLAIEGVIVEPPDERDTYTNLRIAVDQLHLRGEVLFEAAQGLLLAKVSPASAPVGGWRYGDRVRVEGQLQTPPEDETFSYRAYLERQGIHSYMGKADARFLLHGQGNPLLAALYALRQRALETIYRIYPDPEASLLAGILLGIETGIPQSVQEAFKNTGTSHLIAISGFNIAIIAGLFATLFGKLLGVRRGSVAAILGIAAYTILVGASASVLRAAIMGCLGLIAHQVGRRQAAVNSLVFTAALMSLFNPYTPWDIGFQLSFAATLGLVLYADPLAHWAQHQLEARLPKTLAERLAGPLAEYFLFTLAAQILTLPLMAYHFGNISLVAFAVNPLALPVQPPIMTLGGLAVIAGLIWLPLGKLLGLLAWPFVVYTIRVIELFARIPGGVIRLGELALPVLLLVFGVILAWTVLGKRFRGWATALGPSTLLVALAILTVNVWRSALSAPDGRLRVTILEVGAGDGVLIQTPTGRNVLIDGGKSVSKLSDALGRRLPPNALDLDWLVVANPGDDQLTAVPRLFERFRVAQVLWAGPTHGTRAGRDVQAALVVMGIPQTRAEAGQALDLGGGARLRVIHVGQRGATLLLEFDRFRLLLPLGADFETLETLRNGAALGPVSALVLADSGYAPINPPEWIAALNPQVVMISVPLPAREELPPFETLEILAGYNVLRTDLNGWISLSSDGQALSVEVERK